MGLKYLETERWRIQPDVKDLRSMKPSESMKGFWKFIELLPVKRLTYRNRKETTRYVEQL